MPGVLPQLSDQARRALMAISIVTTGIVVALLVWIAFAALTHTIDGRWWPGAAFLLVMGNDAALGKAVAGGWILLSYGAGFIAQSQLRDRDFYLIVALSAIGAILSIVLMIIMGDKNIYLNIAKYADGDLAQAAPYHAAQNVLMGGLIAWFIGTLATQLGPAGFGGTAPANTAVPAAPVLPPADPTHGQGG
jgi:protein-S-isoprenylcysteine O-methyltransferase Ste14